MRRPCICRLCSKLTCTQADVVTYVRLLPSRLSYQNCDDAGAAKVLFLLDCGSYDATSVLTPEAAALQGPALILASSKPLDDGDLLRILRLGDSEKRKDFAQQPVK